MTFQFADEERMIIELVEKFVENEFTQQCDAILTSNTRN